MSQEAVRDVLRFVLVFLPAFVLFGLALSTVIEYTKAYLLDRKIAKVTGSKTYGLLPRHVSTIGLSYLLMVGYIMWDFAQLLGQPARNPVYFLLAGPAMYIGIYALWTMTRFQRKRHNDASPSPF